MTKLYKMIADSLPKIIVYWCVIRVIAHATTGRYADQIVPELTAIDALKRWHDTNAEILPLSVK